MLIIAQKEVYASEILEELKDANLIVVEGTLYPLLSRIRKLGLIEYNWQESTSGPPRKYYSLTEAGKAQLTALDEYWSRINRTIADMGH